MISHDLEVSLNLAVSEAARRGHEYVTIEHILFALLQNDSATRALRACGASIEVTKSKIEEFFSEHIPGNVLKTGQMPQPTVGFQRVIQRSAQHVRSAGKDRIKGENILVSMFSERDSFAVYILQQQNISRFDVINYISHGIAKLSDGSFDTTPRLPSSDNEDTQESDSKSGDDQDGESSIRHKGIKDPLAAYAVDLNLRAKEGRIDPLIGRELEVERTVQILCRRRKNNPLLVGDAGVGKTAIAEGLAWKITQGDIPTPLKDAQIFALDMGALLAGTKFRGDFEQRMKGVIDAIKKRKNAILFIDEIHTVIGAGQVSGGTMDAGNLLKPALSNGDVRCIGSTTYKEFRQYFEGDAALSRRFQKIDVEEPSIENAVKILKGLKSKYEEHHHVKYSEESLKAAVELSAKYLRDKKLPDKAIDVMDEVGASFALKGHSKQSTKMKRVSVEDVQGVIAKMAKVPAEKVSNVAKQELKDLGARIKGQVFGQNEAIDAIAAMIKLNRSGLGSSDKPIGSFLFAGPTGVGKTEVAKQLALTMGIEFIRFDMSEYMERHAVSRLIGAPPGYVGFEQGGLLTEAINKTPHAVLLLDEIEKAHPDMQNILLQVFDHGTLTDNNGRKADFRNTIIIMTTNAGARDLLQANIGFGRPSTSAQEGEIQALKDLFSPEFRNRLDATITFKPLAREIVLLVVDKFIDELSMKLALKKVDLQVSDRLRNWLAEKGYHPSYGARPLARTVQDHLKKPLADELLFGKLSKNGGKVKADLDDNDKPIFKIESGEPK
ncbi:MAG: ATP-dependent Clp protease ATP-binding subunit ClpA [Proteobacteria bacterium]|nr:ATP-dependent Clp protease ATP-binding subunit ClpA [Pseudomonadota bacterium]